MDVTEKRIEALEQLVFAQDVVLKTAINALFGIGEASGAWKESTSGAARDVMAETIERSIDRFPNEDTRAVILRSYVEWLRSSRPDESSPPSSGGALQ